MVVYRIFLCNGYRIKDVDETGKKTFLSFIGIFLNSLFLSYDVSNHLYQ
ncbi:hypothetical protein ES708_24730 [subsurface metagenome]